MDEECRSIPSVLLNALRCALRNSCCQGQEAAVTDLFYSALNRALDDAAPRIVRVKCGWCEGIGKVEVRDGTAFPALAICSQCCGRGYINVEAKS